MNHLQKKVILIANDSPKLPDGAIGITKSRWRKLKTRQDERDRTLQVVCARCWLSNKHNANAHVGTMRKVGENHYEHVNCPMDGGE